jgi:type II secretory pathway component PulM
MKMLTPAYDKKTAAFQGVVVLLFAVALYFFLYSLQVEKRVTRELATMAEQRGQLAKIQENVEQFNTVLKKNSGLENLTGKPTWEAVDFKWQSLSFAELVERIDNLSHQQKIFVMESMEVGQETVERDNDEAGFTAEEEKRFYHLRGYFLCPCL